MSNIRIFFPESLSLNFNSWLEKPQSHYLTKVMRVKIGENFSLFNKNGEWLAKINNISSRKVESSIQEKLKLFYFHFFLRNFLSFEVFLKKGGLFYLTALLPL